MFIEAILSLLTIGVISLNKDFEIALANKTTNRIFNNTKKITEKSNFLKIFPEWENLVINFLKAQPQPI